MPLYDYQCDAGHRFDRIVKLQNLSEEQFCFCGRSASRVIRAPAVRGDYAGYDCPVTGKWIEGRKAHNENLKRHGCRVFERGEKEAAMKHHAREEAALDKSVDATVDEFVAKLPARKREQLFTEVQQGATASVVRN